MIAAWVSFLVFIVKAVFIAGSSFVLWQALRKQPKKGTVLLSMLGAGAIAGVAMLYAQTPALSASYFTDETQANGEDAPVGHFTGDAPGVAPLADGQGAFMQKMFILASVVGAFSLLSLGSYVFGSPQVSFQCSSIGIFSALVGLTFL